MVFNNNGSARQCRVLLFVIVLQLTSGGDFWRQRLGGGVTGESHLIYI
jgi:hypothetical protein